MYTSSPQLQCRSRYPHSSLPTQSTSSTSVERNALPSLLVGGRPGKAPQERKERQMGTMTPLEAVSKLSKDLKQASILLTRNEARYLVDSYYSMQEDRKRSGNQVRALDKSGEPHGTLSWFFDQSNTLESQIKGALQLWAENQIEGKWLMSITGIGPVISAGLLAHIDIEQAPTVGHIWRFGGYDPTVKWEKGKKRPWNASLKTLCVKPDCRITTRRGHLLANEVRIGDEVLTHLGRWRRVEQVFVNEYEGPVYGLRSANAGNQVAWLTPGHPVYSAPIPTWTSGRTVKAKCTSGVFDWLPVESIQPRWKLSRPVNGRQVDEMPAPCLTLEGVDEGEYVAAAGRWDGVRAPRATSVLREVAVDVDMMRMIGLYLAEGHINRTNVMWGFHSEEKELLAFVRLMIHTKLTNHHDPVVSYHNNGVQVSVGCKPLAEEFASRFGTGPHDVRFPMDWLSLSDDLLQALWDGIMAGDGDHRGLYKDRRITTVSPTFARQVMDLGRRLGYSVSLHEEPNGACRVHVNERQDIEPAARETLQSDYAGLVYNFEVEEDHSYVVEGYAVHNCWKVGESFVKVSGNDKDLYGKVWAARKAIETEKNERLEFKEQAEIGAARVRKTTEAYKHYSVGKLPPGHIHARAKRYAVKLFLSHFHHVLYLCKFGTPPPKPFILEHGGHVHFIEPPNLDVLGNFGVDK
jgi:hypothetical protein